MNINIMIEGNDKKINKIKKKRVRKLKKAEYHQLTLSYLTNLVERRPNTKIVKLVNSEGEVQKVLYKRNEIEVALIK